MGEAWHIAVFIVEHRCSWRRSGSWRASRLAAAGTSSLAALAALSFIGEGCGHHIGVCCSSGGFFRLLLLFRFPVFWMAEAFKDSRASSSAAA
jgi:hypothetical protein